MRRNAALQASLPGGRVRRDGRDGGGRARRVWDGPGELGEWRAGETAGRRGVDLAARRRAPPPLPAPLGGPPRAPWVREAPASRGAGNSGAVARPRRCSPTAAGLAKRVMPGGDWIGRADGGPRHRERCSPRAARLPPRSTRPSWASSPTGGGWWILMRDVGDSARERGRPVARRPRDPGGGGRAARGLRRRAPRRRGLCSLRDPGILARHRGRRARRQRPHPQAARDRRGMLRRGGRATSPRPCSRCRRPGAAGRGDAAPPAARRSSTATCATTTSASPTADSCSSTGTSPARARRRGARLVPVPRRLAHRGHARGAHRGLPRRRGRRVSDGLDLGLSPACDIRLDVRPQRGHAPRPGRARVGARGARRGGSASRRARAHRRARVMSAAVLHGPGDLRVEEVSRRRAR